MLDGKVVKKSIASDNIFARQLHRIFAAKLELRWDI